MKAIVKTQAARGMIADVAIHDRAATDGDRNPHAHILLTMREVWPEGFGGKEREWNKTELVEAWRERWAAYCNEALAQAGEEARIDHRTLEAQGIMREPTTHLGKDAFHASQKGQEIQLVSEQPSLVERIGGIFRRQIEEQGHVTIAMTPEAGESWWERMASFTRRVSGQARELASRAREAWEGWTRRGDEGEEPGPVRRR